MLKSVTLGCCVSLLSLTAHAEELVVPAVPAGPQPPSSVQIIDDVGAGTRIDLAGKLRMLSQRVPSALCAIESGVDSEAAEIVLTQSSDEVMAILSALSAGDDARGVFGAETDPKVLRGIERLEETAEPMVNLAREIVRLGATPVDVAAVQARSHEMLERAKDLVAVVEAEYANPAELLLADAMTVNVAGRQRMLAQRMAKDACLMTSGHGSAALAEDLGRTMATYGASLLALRHGMPGAGVIAPPSDAVSEGLEDIAADWAELEPRLAVIRDGRPVDAETRAMLFHGLNGLTGKMNAVVGLYAEESKLGL